MAADSSEPANAMNKADKDLDMAAVKELPFPVARKKEIWARLLRSNAKGITFGKQREPSQKWKKFKEHAVEAIRFCELWRSSIHEIEGRFGAGVCSYFAFLRLLFILNIIIFAILFFFVCLPTISDPQQSVPDYMNSALCSCEPYDAATGTSKKVCGVNSTSNLTEICSCSSHDISSAQDILTGKGFVENSSFFYGYYKRVVKNAVSTSQYYDISVAYILMTFSYFFISFMLILRKAGKGIMEYETSGESRFSYCNKVFGGWDFCIADRKAADLNHSSIKYELESNLMEKRISKMEQSLTMKERLILYTKRVFINIFIFGIIAGSLAGIYFAAKTSLNGPPAGSDRFQTLLIGILDTIVLTLVNFGAPMIFGLLIQYEELSPEMMIKLTLIRTVMLRLASIMILCFESFTAANCFIYKEYDNRTGSCAYCDELPCWETRLGQQMYKLTIVDFIIGVAKTLFMELPRRLIVTFWDNRLTRLVGLQEFLLTGNVLHIVYTQTVLWIGAFFSPLLPIVVIMKFFLLFYLRKLSLKYIYKPADRPYRASKSGTFFFIILMFGFTLAMVAVGFGLFNVTPSEKCGPFRKQPTMFFTITTKIQNLPEWLEKTLEFIGSAGFSIVALVLFCLVIYFFSALNSAKKKVIRLTKRQLAMESRDKKFLAQRISNFQSKVGENKSDDTESRDEQHADVPEKQSTVVYESENKIAAV